MVGIVEGTAELFDIFGGVHTEKVVEVLAEVFYVIEAYLGGNFANVVLCTDHDLGGFAQADKTDKAIDGLPGD